MLSRTWMVRLAAAAGCATLLTTPVLADEPSPRAPLRVVLRQNQQPQAEVEVETQRNEPRRVEDARSSHWLGLECLPLDVALRSHLGLAEGEGLIIEQVVPDSPAAKAELKRHDVVVRAGGAAVKSLSDLMKAVDEAKENELALEIIRGGKPMTMKATPAKRPDVQDLRRNAYRDDVRAWFDRFNRGDDNNYRYRFFGPGAVLPGGEKGLPKGVSVSITRSGGEPAKITVKKGEETWEIGEKELDKLPDDVRPHVERMLGRGVLALPGVPPVPVAPAIVPPPPVAPSAAGSAGPPLGRGSREAAQADDGSDRNAAQANGRAAAEPAEGSKAAGQREPCVGHVLRLESRLWSRDRLKAGLQLALQPVHRVHCVS